MYSENSSMPPVGVVLDPGAYMPTRGHGSDAGLDLRTPVDFYVFEHGDEVIDTGVHLIIPEGWCGLLVSKSGLNVSLDTAISTTGLIDAGFTGSIRVRVHTDSTLDTNFKAGDKITQIVFLRHYNPPLVLRDVICDGERGDKGYGSTGR